MSMKQLSGCGDRMLFIYLFSRSVVASLLSNSFLLSVLMSPPPCVFVCGDVCDPISLTGGACMSMGGRLFTGAWATDGCLYH